MRRNITEYQFNSKVRKLVIQTPYYFETLIILKLWNFIKTTKCIDFENYIYKVVITATININYKHQDFMLPAWVSVDLLSVLDFLEQDLALVYKISCNTWLERYSETFSCFSDFQVSIEICDIDDQRILVKHSLLTHGIPYFYFYWDNLSHYTIKLATYFGRIAEFIWGNIVVFLSRFLCPRFFCVFVARCFLTLLFLIHHLRNFLSFLFFFTFKYFRQNKK